jgi:hypothetical protein
MADKPKPKRVKPEKDPSEKPQQFFWVTMLEKRKAKKNAYVRESSLPKPVMSKEDKMKLIGAGTIFVVVVLGFIIMNAVSNKPPVEVKPGAPSAAAAKDDKKVNKALGDEGG